MKISQLIILTAIISSLPTLVFANGPAPVTCESVNMCTFDIPGGVPNPESQHVTIRNFAKGRIYDCYFYGDLGSLEMQNIVSDPISSRATIEDSTHIGSHPLVIDTTKADKDLTAVSFDILGKVIMSSQVSIRCAAK